MGITKAGVNRNPGGHIIVQVAALVLSVCENIDSAVEQSVAPEGVNVPKVFIVAGITTIGSGKLAGGGEVAVQEYSTTAFVST